MRKHCVSLAVLFCSTGLAWCQTSEQPGAQSHWRAASPLHPNNQAPVLPAEPALPVLPGADEARSEKDSFTATSILPERDITVPPLLSNEQPPEGAALPHVLVPPPPPDQPRMGSINLLPVVPRERPPLPQPLRPPQVVPVPPIVEREMFTHREAATGERFWASADFLLWWTKDLSPPALVGSAGLVGPIQPLFGDGAGDLDFARQAGYRLRAGGRLDPDGTWGSVEVGYFEVERARQRFTAVSNGNPVLGPVFVDAVSQQPVLAEFAFPGQSQGRETVETGTKLWGADAHALTRLDMPYLERVQLLYGFSHLQLRESLEVTSTASFYPISPIRPGETITTFDSIGCHNAFYGGQIGFTSTYCMGRMVLDTTVKVGLGDMHETVKVHGATNENGTVNNGGILAQSTNSGERTTDTFAFVPEITLNLGYQFNSALKAFVGYNFLYISDVVRPDQHIGSVDSREVRVLQAFNPTVQPTTPAFTFQHSDFWAQGLNVGLEWRY